MSSSKSNKPQVREDPLRGIHKFEARHHIDINHLIAGGAPIIRGTRIRVDLILEMFGRGLRPKEIVSEYPRLSIEAVSSLFDFYCSY